ncbi:AAA domain-containing protein [Plectosphaerella plurivora]|uniref:AAA domain-containing protein n=1 Tax=Plectosphaerella plurivora TaxID=936078 RepID=A0A9P8V4G1_9PEZI|nr:AAA domain-containing protein [Plectosphaerella plurivora]
MATTKNIYIVGAQCTGKTTLVNALESHFSAQPAHDQPAIVREVARTVLKTHSLAATDIRSSPDSALHMQKLMLHAQVEAERHAMAEASWFISDRSAVDPICYALKHVGEDGASQLLATEAWAELRPGLERGLVFDSYKQYKDDTNRFSTWLVNLEAAPTAAKKKKNKKKKAGSAAPKPPVKYGVTGGELLAIARTVSKSKIKPPPRILNLAKRAIALRKSVTSWFVTRGRNASNKKHAHFIQVMEQICEILSWETTGTSDPTNGADAEKAADAEDADSPAWINRFASLTVEDTEDDPEPSETSTNVIRVEAVEKDEEETVDFFLSESFFKILCLLHDLTNWRQFLTDPWTDYSNLKIDLATASVVTDTALQLARDLIEDVYNELPSYIPVDGLSLQELVLVTASKATNIPIQPSRANGLPFNEKLAPIVDFAFLTTGVLLNSFLDILDDDEIPVYKSGFYGTYNAKADRSKMSAAEKFNEDKILMLELLPEYAMIAIFNTPLPVRDEVAAGFVEYYTKKDFNLWHCFAAQVLLDAHHATRHSRLGAADDLRMNSLRIARTIDDFRKLSETHPKPEFWPKEGDIEINNIHSIITEWIEKDPLKQMRAAAQSLAPRNVQHSGAQQLLFTRNPVLCGILAFHLNIRMQTIGQGLVTQWYDVQQLAFLYNLVQQIPENKMTWPDLDLFIKIHGENHIFVGDRPKDAEQSLNRLELATGTINLVRDRYQKYIPGTTPAAKFLDELTKASPSSTTIVPKDTQAGSLAQVRALLSRKWRNTHHVGTLQLLALMKEKLSEEEPILLFDYFGMHKRSIKILRLIKAKEHHKFVQYFTENYMPSEAFIANLVLLILHVAPGPAKSSKALGVKTAPEKGLHQVSRIVVSCGEVMDPYLKKNGDAAIKFLRLFAKTKKQVLALVGEQQTNEALDADERKYMYWLCMDEVLGPAEMESLKTGIPLA